MTAKEYRVTKAVKVDGEEKGEGDIVALEASQAAGLVGVFVEEYTATDKKNEKGASTSAASTAKTGKNDGL